MKFCVVGAGAWGTAFAVHLARVGQTVALVPRRASQATALCAARENSDYLPGIALPTTIGVTADLAAAAAEADVILLACPAQALRDTSRRLQVVLGPASSARLVVSLAKGLELGSHLRPSEVLAAMLPDLTVGALAGPTNAGEIARGLPAAMVLATSRAEPMAMQLPAAVSNASLRLYTSDDLPGVEFGGCLKNIYAIAAGCCEGLHLGDNARAALLTRALTEMVRVGAALGARPETFYGLSGFGDLVATCHGAWSRNREFGQRIGEGIALKELLERRRTVVEGYRTTESFHGLCQERGIEAPILAEMYRVLFAARPPAEALMALMLRELKKE